ncbi:dol-P-Glc:Glc(2)Man(9)GlcNAc(2)-PP-Dol alpha-1,2-glucosyltransferase isoform X2 [Mercurialis annua]|nr:dol-P-Glc:Glc(2)Man(9)GlcNAc(2)-PP-Dol alpha-1,2-glucosyltransferase isoform X2 [Mercurialis annua]
MFVVRLVSLFSEACSTTILRSTNCVMAVLCSVIVYEIIVHLRPILDERKATLLAAILALYPLHWFYTFLYYTDVASLTAVLAMYLACLKKKYHFSALFGALAVFIRQTNIIWMVFVACTGVIDLTLTSQCKNVKMDELNEIVKEASNLFRSKSVTEDSNMRRRKPTKAAYARKYLTFSMNSSRTTDPTGFLDEIREICLTSWRMKWKIILSFSPFLIILAAFFAFVRWNGSVVLGAKEAHTVSLHFAQIMYFGLISALAAAPLHFSLNHGAKMLQSIWKNRALSLSQLLVAFIVGFLSVHLFSIAHPYLLADNRHYPFYLWRKVIGAHWLMKYLLIPFYVYSWFSIFSILVKGRQRTWVLAYFLATAAVLVPAPLIEFRYYTIPFFFLMLHSRIDDNRSLILIGLMYAVINTFTMTMFLFRPFYWSHEPGVQRFIW